MFKGDWGPETKGWGGVWTDGSKGTWRAGKGAPMGGNTQQRQSAKGQPSVCEIDPHVSLPSRSLTARLRNGGLTGTPSFIFRLIDDGFYGRNPNPLLRHACLPVQTY